jgi:hypothetical protein
MNRLARPFAGLALALLVGGCSSVRTDEGLVILDVSASAGVPVFASVRFSVVGRRDIPTHEVAYDPARHLRLGYYVPGPAGAAQVHAEALSAANCIVGQGTATVDVELGRVSPAVALVVGPATGAGPDGGVICPARLDGAADRRSSDGATDSRSNDGATDSRRPEAGVPACLAATLPCSAASKCCSGLTCSSNSIGQVCCGAAGASCTRTDGADCCGTLSCRNGTCAP